MFQEGRLAKMMTTTKLVLYDLISVRKGQKLLNTGWLKPHKEPPASGFFLNKRLWNLCLLRHAVKLFNMVSHQTTEVLPHFHLDGEEGMAHRKILSQVKAKI